MSTKYVKKRSTRTSNISFFNHLDGLRRLPDITPDSEYNDVFLPAPVIKVVEPKIQPAKNAMETAKNITFMKKVLDVCVKVVSFVLCFKLIGKLVSCFLPKQGSHYESGMITRNFLRN